MIGPMQFWGQSNFIFPQLCGCAVIFEHCKNTSCHGLGEPILTAFDFLASENVRGPFGNFSWLHPTAFSSTTCSFSLTT